MPNQKMSLAIRMMAYDNSLLDKEYALSSLFFSVDCPVKLGP